MKLKFEIELEQLFISSCNGNKEAYRKFFNLLTIYLRKILSQKIFKSVDVEDVIQEILVSIHKSKHTYDGNRPLKPWINAIISYRVSDYLREHYSENDNQKISIDKFFDIEDENSVTDLTDNNEDIIKALDKLNAKQRSVIELMYLQDLSVKEVSKILKMNESAVKVTAHRAYKILREYIKR